MNTSNGTILGMKCEGFAVVVTDSLATISPLKTVTYTDVDKTIAPCPRIHLVCSGHLDCLHELRSTLLDTPFPNINSEGQAAAYVTEHINNNHSVHWGSGARSLEILLVGNIISPSIYNIKKKEGENSQEYVLKEVEGPITAIGSGESKINHLLHYFNPNVDPEKAVDFGNRILSLATKTDWETGGDIRIITIHPDRSDTSLFQQDDPRNSNSPYSIRTNTSDDPNSPFDGVPRRIV